MGHGYCLPEQDAAAGDSKPSRLLRNQPLSRGVGRRLRTVGDVRLVENAAHVMGDGAEADEQIPGDLPVTLAKV